MAEMLIFLAFFFSPLFKVYSLCVSTVERQEQGQNRLLFK